MDRHGLIVHAQKRVIERLDEEVKMLEQKHTQAAGDPLTTPARLKEIEVSLMETRAEKEKRMKWLLPKCAPKLLPILVNNYTLEADGETVAFSDSQFMHTIAGHLENARNEKKVMF
jgi:hypothetical protein